MSLLHENDTPFLPIPELRNTNRIASQDFSVQSALFTFLGIAVPGDTALQPITNENLAPFHIGATPGQPVLAYLVIRDVLVTVFANAGAANMGAVVIYRDPFRVEHFLCAIGTTLAAAGNSQAFNNHRLRLISERGLNEKQVNTFGDIFIRTYTWGGAGAADVRVMINFGVQYGS